MNEITALFLSFGLIFAIIGIASALLLLKLLTADISRKIIHIGVSNWWIFAMYTMKHTLIAVIGPVSFILINYISYRKHLIPAIETSDSEQNLGTIYFPISLLILVLLCYSGPLSLAAGAAGILVMGYGDGLAAIAGSYLGKKQISIGPIQTRKTVIGSLTMLTVSFIVILLTALFLSSDNPTPWSVDLWTWSLLIAGAAAAVELATPMGLDNITVPLITAILFWAVPL